MSSYNGNNLLNKIYTILERNEELKSIIYGQNETIIDFGPGFDSEIPEMASFNFKIQKSETGTRIIGPPYKPQTK